MSMWEPQTPAGEEYLASIHAKTLIGIGPEQQAAIARGEYTEQELFDYYAGINAARGEGEGVEARIWREYPAYAYLLDDPEIGPLLIQSAEEGWTAEYFEARLASTRWFQARSQNMRDWEALKRVDPSEAIRRRERTALDIQQIAKQNGIALGNNQAVVMAEEALMHGWSDAEIRSRLATMVKEGRVALDENAFADIRNQIGRWAWDYMIKLSDNQIDKYARKVFAGDMSIEQIQADFKAKSSAAYPWMTEQIAGGIAPRDYYAPLVADYARLLELNPDSIDIMDPQYSHLVSVNEDGQRRAPTRTEVEQHARSRPEWLGTRNGAESTARMGLQVFETMGMIST